MNIWSRLCISPSWPVSGLWPWKKWRKLMKNTWIWETITALLWSAARPTTATALCSNIPSPATARIISGSRITQRGVLFNRRFWFLNHAARRILWLRLQNNAAQRILWLNVRVPEGTEKHTIIKQTHGYSPCVCFTLQSYTFWKKKDCFLW